MNGGKFKRKLSEVNTRAVFRRQNELVGKLKMVSGDMVSIRGQVMEYTYIPTGIKREIKVDNRQLKKVDHFKYLGSVNKRWLSTMELPEALKKKTLLPCKLNIELRMKMV